MLRGHHTGSSGAILRRSGFLSTTSFYSSSTQRSYSNPIASEEPSITAARQWLATFSRSRIPDSTGEVSYARSSGPGGQNVNKLNTKALLRVPLPALSAQTSIPQLLLQSLRTSPYYTAKADSLLISADDSRRQSENREQCYQKLAGLIHAVGRRTVPGEMREGMQERVRELRRKENEGRLKVKKENSKKKEGRRKGGGGRDD